MAQQGTHVAGMEYVVDLEPEKVLVIGDSHAFTCLHEGICQFTLDGAVGVGDGGVIEVAADQEVIAGGLPDLLGDQLCLFSAYLKGGA